eukprot:scaffold11869_cov152-Skeletonema_marinoi.AAC.4
MHKTPAPTDIFVSMVVFETRIPCVQANVCLVPARDFDAQHMTANKGGKSKSQKRVRTMLP